MINRSISFCIATAKNEKEYVLLLLRSLRDNTDITKHEIVIFIDSDNQNTYEALLQEQQNMPNIKICKNPYDSIKTK
jgi:glycosyltransferase involved in cell wall biosynthesis